MTRRAGPWAMAVLPLPALLVLAAVGCAAPPPPPSTLSESQARSVWLPERLGWVSSERASGALPSAIALGGKASGRVLVYLEFDAPPEPGRLLRAALLLDTDGAPGSSIEVELSRADPARARLDSWSDQPAARYPRLSRSLSSAPAPVRLDVTALVRAERKVGEPLRLLLRAEPSSAEPVLLATGAAGGAAPRLEIYRE